MMFHGAIADQHSLTATDTRTLELLDRLGPQSAGEIAAHTGLAATSVTALIDRLEARGLVRRAADANDRRKVLVARSAANSRAQSAVRCDCECDDEFDASLRRARAGGDCGVSECRRRVRGEVRGEPSDRCDAPARGGESAIKAQRALASGEWLLRRRGRVVIACFDAVGFCEPRGGNSSSLIGR